eukprot:CAMPEP_0170527264 /NCGR_PEP_ID=MMETSP0209-20121228/12741_1 /TAXON_ID=665100 ORGANISM="Litonotus pictus, Strain P1" /NCGR_SAMPLE_ID=MMETSP0209 /ASSEMBLY_ACC=CAM_ASM_000301 /LENGTH=269 /DNA_ID=CAMNT_0010817683 /DNA_START=789 /DNA_END=1598 /DNA_ORIENTATION=+
MNYINSNKEVEIRNDKKRGDTFIQVDVDQPPPLQGSEELTIENHENVKPKHKQTETELKLVERDSNSKTNNTFSTNISGNMSPKLNSPDNKANQIISPMIKSILSRLYSFSEILKTYIQKNSLTIKTEFFLSQKRNSVSSNEKVLDDLKKIQSRYDIENISQDIKSFFITDFGLSKQRNEVRFEQRMNSDFTFNEKSFVVGYIYLVTKNYFLLKIRQSDCGKIFGLSASCISRYTKLIETYLEDLRRAIAKEEKEGGGDLVSSEETDDG